MVVRFTSCLIAAALGVGFAGTAQAATGLGLPPASLAASAAIGEAMACGEGLVVNPAAMPAAFSSKSEAILGGAPSQLDLVLRRQSGMQSNALAQTATPRIPVAAPCASTGSSAQFVLPGFTAPLRSLTGQAAIAGEYMASRRLTIAHTRFDRQWEQVSRTRMSVRMERTVSAIAGEGPAMARIEAVNTWANTHIRYVDDQQLYNRADYWADARKTLRLGAGDCEDVAIVKLQMLAAAGIARSDIYFVIARDLARRADHALLVVRDGDRFWMLDNATNKLVDARTDASDYRPIFSYSQNEKWLHGY